MDLYNNITKTLALLLLTSIIQEKWKSIYNYNLVFFDIHS